MWIVFSVTGEHTNPYLCDPGGGLLGDCPPHSLPTEGRVHPDAGRGWIRRCVLCPASQVELE